MSEVALYLGRRGTGKSHRMDRDRREWPRCLLFDSIGESTYDRMERIGSFGRLCQRLAEDPPCFQIAYRGYDSELPREVDFDRFCRAAYCSSDLLVIVEEADLFCTPHKIREPFQQIIETGRHREISLWVATRHAGRLHMNLRSQANRIVTFRQIEPRHLKWIEEAVGPELAERLPHLAQYEAVVWRDGYEIKGTAPSKAVDSDSIL